MISEQEKPLMAVESSLPTRRILQALAMATNWDIFVERREEAVVAEDCVILGRAVPS
jgi:hypothetical protein